MEIVSIKNKSLVGKVLETLKSGGVVMYPTETCYGFAVDVFNEKALDKLYRLKQMDKSKPVSILIDGLGMADDYGVFSDKAIELARDYWPGALSIIVPRKRSLPDFFNEKEEYVSLRFSSDAFCTFMVSMLGRPVTTTSANISGKPQLYSADTTQFGDAASMIDLVVDGGEIKKNKPSTIVKVVGDEIEVLRAGDVEIS